MFISMPAPPVSSWASPLLCGAPGTVFRLPQRQTSEVAAPELTESWRAWETGAEPGPCLVETIQTFMQQSKGQTKYF
jgi:hypothetical protein